MWATDAFSKQARDKGYSGSRALRMYRPQSSQSASRSPGAVFEKRLRQIVRPGNRVLDAGCGRGKFCSFAFAKALGCTISGVDTSDELHDNPHLDTRIRADLSKLPFASQSFDVINCRLVVEHLLDPEPAFQEFHRVLKRGGKAAIFTPNLFHYFGAAAKVTPDWFHRWFNSQIRGFEISDIFPTYYRANTRYSLNEQLERAGFTQVEIALVEGAPDVLAFDFILHSLGKAYKKLVDRFDFLSAFRLNIIAICQKSQAQDRGPD